MSYYLIFDAVIVVLLLVFLIRGASRGLLLSLCSLLAVAVALVGALFLSNLLAPKVGAVLEPRFATLIEEKLDQQLQAAAPDLNAPPATTEELPLMTVLNILKDFGLYQSAVESIDNAISQGLTATAATVAAQVAAAIAQMVARVVIFLIAFILLLVAWTLLSRALDLVTYLPGLHFLNKTGGALFGLAKGCVLLFVLGLLVRYSGQLIPEHVVEKTYLLRFFVTTNPVALLTGLS